MLDVMIKKVLLQYRLVKNIICMQISLRPPCSIEMYIEFQIIKQFTYILQSMFRLLKRVQGLDLMCVPSAKRNINKILVSLKVYEL